MFTIQFLSCSKYVSSFLKSTTSGQPIPNALARCLHRRENVADVRRRWADEVVLSGKDYYSYNERNMDILNM